MQDIARRLPVSSPIRRESSVWTESVSARLNAIFVREMDEIVRSWNRGAEALYGWTAAEAESRVVSELLKTVSPIPLDHAIAELLHTGRWEGELVRSRKDGTRRWWSPAAGHLISFRSINSRCVEGTIAVDDMDRTVRAVDDAGCALSRDRHSAA
jgi:PAS domain S-box-containing protein